MVNCVFVCAPPTVGKGTSPAQTTTTTKKRRNKKKERHPFFFLLCFTFWNVCAIVMPPFRIVSSRRVSGDARFASVEQVFDFVPRVLVVVSFHLLLFFFFFFYCCTSYTVDLLCWCVVVVVIIGSGGSYQWRVEMMRSVCWQQAVTL